MKESEFRLDEIQNDDFGLLAIEIASSDWTTTWHTLRIVTEEERLIFMDTLNVQSG